MDRIKTFRKYLITYGLLALVLALLTHLLLLRPSIQIEYFMSFQSPAFTVTEVQATDVVVNIEGEITNNTGEFIRSAYVVIQYFDENERYLGSEYQHLHFFHPNETIRIDITGRYRNVDNVTIHFVDELPWN